MNNSNFPYLKISPLKLLGAFAGVVLFVVLATTTISFSENSTSHKVITDKTIATGGIIGTDSISGGNTYIAFDDKDMENIRQYLIDNGLWNTAIEKSNEIQLEFYKILSQKLEQTYIQALASSKPIKTSGKYTNETECYRLYKSNYANDECDFNGNVENNPELKKGSYAKTCEGGGDIFGIGTTKMNFYKSEESKDIVGGKILGRYPELLVSSTLSQSWTTLDEQVYGDQKENDPPYFDPSFVGPLPANSIWQIFSGTFGWLKTTNMIGVGKEALNDIFDEGSLYTTFRFMADSKCEVKDVARYNSFSGEKHKVTNEYNKSVDYTCVTSQSLNTECVPETYSCKTTDPETGESVDSTCTKYVAGTPVGTDGYPDSYYQSLSGTKYCDYVGNYELSVEWICNPVGESPVKCSVYPVKDDRGTILYYRCSGVNENEVRTKIVDPVFDAYENNTLGENGYLTSQSAIKYIYGDDEEKKKAAKGVNPEGYKIDEETRNLVTKHIVMEILGEIEGRTAAVADKDGNFYLQSYNRVMNREQYEDALSQTILVKDNINDRDKSLNNDQKVAKSYSKAIFGKFFDKFNVEDSNITSMTHDQIINLSEKKKKSLVENIFYVYDEVSTYVEQNSSGRNGTTGSGLGQADEDGYRARTSMPFYGSDDYDEYYSDGLYGECAWYARGRIKEILANGGGDSSIDINGNGADFCDIAKAKYSDKLVVTEGSSAVNNPKKGAVISWGGGNGHNYGHVAIVEDVHYDDNGKAVSVDLSEAGLNINKGVTGDWVKSSNWIWKNDTFSNRKVQCQDSSGNSRCFKYSKNVSVSSLAYRWSGYYFKCYIYLLKENSSYDVDSTILSYINKEFNSDDGKQAKVNYYNFLIGTEGGDKLNSNLTKEYLGEPVKLIGNIEGSNYASVDPGMYLDEWNKMLSITIDGKEYNYKLTYGGTVPRWVALYKYLELYKSNRNKVLNLVSNKGLSSQFNSPTKIHSLMRLVWTYGEGGATSKINELLDAYKSGGEHDVWCKLSAYVLATDSGEVKTFGNYFNMNEMIFDLFLNGTYSENRYYKNYKYYTKARAQNLLNRNYPKFSTAPLEQAIANGELPSSNSYSDCDGD